MSELPGPATVSGRPGTMPGVAGIPIEDLAVMIYNRLVTGGFGGVPGPQGNKGDTGDQGDTGPQGDVGEQGERAQQQVFVQADEPPAGATGPGVWFKPLGGGKFETYVQEGGVWGLTDIDALQALMDAPGDLLQGAGDNAFEKLASGGPANVGKALTVQDDGRWAPETQAALLAGNNPPIAFPGFMAPVLGSGMLVTANAALVGANSRHLVRLVAPKAGVVHDLTIFAGIPGSAPTGQYLAALYDVGGITPGTYTKIWENPPVAAANSVPQAFDPAVTGVKFNGWNGNAAAFQHFLFLLVADHASTTAGRLALGAASYGLLSTTRGLVGGLQPKPFGIASVNGFSAPATLTEAEVAVSSTFCLAAHGWIS